MPTWLYEDGHLVAKDRSGAVLFRREMAEQQARRMAELVNLETEIGDHLLRRQLQPSAPSAAPEPAAPPGDPLTPR